MATFLDNKQINLVRQGCRFSERCVKPLRDNTYKYGFSTIIESDEIKSGLNLETIRLISHKKNESGFIINFREKAFKKWQSLKDPTWAELSYPVINYQAIKYYSSPKAQEKLKSIDEVDPELRDTFERLGIPLNEQKRLANVAVDAVFDSVSIFTTFKRELLKLGIIFCSISEAINKYPELVKKYLGSVVPITDNYFVALNSAVFTDGSFAYIPKNLKSPIELSTYFRINNEESGQFERTLIIAESGSMISYLEGCTAPKYDSNQLHAAVVELISHEGAHIRYSTVQNWYAGDKKGKGGVYNFVTKRGLCLGTESKISWTQVETGSAVTWKYPSCILMGNASQGEFYSVALTTNYQQADTGTKMIHIGKNTKSRILSKGISGGHSKNTYRGLIQFGRKASQAMSYSQCDSLLLAHQSETNTFPYINVRNSSARVEHEASISRIGEEQIFYFHQRGIPEEEAIKLIVNGFCQEVFRKLPMEFALEAEKLLDLKVEKSLT
jgi:Fe-S cluster assembly protein SufB|uniref:ABC transporter n=1 Tax=Microchloropsis salina TaxID=2511165 RepID=T1RI29_9STRA|nr:cysteine desulfurase [Microchloropsis salina]AGI99170.1 cysteine desulfurase [Microchloropsis salina]AHX25467.1 ABC transporter [Microchloropsis salina]